MFAKIFLDHLTTHEVSCLSFAFRVTGMVSIKKVFPGSIYYLPIEEDDTYETNDLKSWYSTGVNGGFYKPVAWAPSKQQIFEMNTLDWKQCSLLLPKGSQQEFIVPKIGYHIMAEHLNVPLTRISIDENGLGRIDHDSNSCLRPRLIFRAAD